MSSEIYIDCHPEGNDDEKILIKKKKVSFVGGVNNSEEVQVIVASIIAFGVLSVAVYLGKKYFFTKRD